MTMILILEDDPLIALDMVLTIEDDCNAEVVVAGTLTAAGKLDLNDLDVAILDVNIGHQTSYAFARQLLGAGITFAFASASRRSEIPVDLGDVPFFSKPCSRSKMLEFIRQALISNAQSRSYH
jgi:DNA-binding response OmpR family regulator